MRTDTRQGLMFACREHVDVRSVIKMFGSSWGSLFSSRHRLSIAGLQLIPFLYLEYSRFQLPSLKRVAKKTFSLPSPICEISIFLVERQFNNYNST